MFQSLKTSIEEKNAQLLIASKTQSEAALFPFLEAGHRLFGENRVQEACQKWPALKQKYPDCRLHLIGPLQTNKIEQAFSIFDVIESIDRPKLVEKIAQLLPHAPHQISFFVQVNIGREPQKSGVLPENLSDLMALCGQRNLSISGFMCIPPEQEDPTFYFHQMRDLQKQYNLQHLSMGMSHDYKQALDCGATIVRIGSLLFGKRS